MTENTQLVEQPERKIGPVQQVKLLLNEDTVKKRFTDVLGKKAPQFMASIVNVVSASPQLKQCEARMAMRNMETISRMLSRLRTHSLRLKIRAANRMTSRKNSTSLSSRKETLWS